MPGKSPWATGKSNTENHQLSGNLPRQIHSFQIIERVSYRPRKNESSDFFFSERRPTPFWWSRRSHGTKSIWQELDWCQKSTPCLKAVNSTSAFFYPQKRSKKKLKSCNHGVFYRHTVNGRNLDSQLIKEVLSHEKQQFFNLANLWFSTSHVTGPHAFFLHQQHRHQIWGQSSCRLLLDMIRIQPGFNFGWPAHTSFWILGVIFLPQIPGFGIQILFFLPLMIGERWKFCTPSK